jgi:glycosyltransferase involved in cell wall biosynthesis
MEPVNLPATNRPIRVAAIMEAATVTGPARNLLEFAARARVPDSSLRSADVEIVTFLRGAALPDNAFIAAARARSIKVHSIPENSRYDTGVLSRLAKTIKSIGPDIVQTHGVKSHFLVSLLGVRDLATSWVAFHHGYTAEDTKMRLYNQLDRWSLRRADRVVTVCTPFVNRLMRTGIGSDRIDVLPNTIEPGTPAPAAEIDALRQEFGISGSQRVLLSVGRLSPEKGHRDLLEAVRRLSGEQPGIEVRLVLVGDGPLRNELERTAQELGIAARLVFAGHRAYVWPFYGLADVFVLPSHSEGSPNVLLEAMSAGLPIVSTNVGGVSDMIEDHLSGLLAAPHSPAELSARAAELLSDGELATRLGCRAADRVARLFRPDNYRQSLLGIYEHALQSSL